ncbi:MAG: 50S ribosomal protein L30e [Promethearchaeota archaeon]
MVKKKTKNVSEKLDLSRKKKKEFDIDTNIKVAMNTGKFLFGKKQVLKHLRSEPFKMIIIANNCPADLEDKLDYHNSLMKDKIYVHRYKGSSWDLGLACAKPYMISIIGVVQEGDSDLLTLRT